MPMSVRTIKPELFSCIDMADVSLPARMTFIGLLSYVDDEGRAVDDSRLVKAAVYPLDDMLATEVERHLCELSQTPEPLVCRYSLNGRRYLHIPRFRDDGVPKERRAPWGQRQYRSRPSRYPACENDHKGPGQDELFDNSEIQCTSTDRAEQFLRNETPVTSNQEPVTSNQGLRARTARGTRLPDDWQPSQRDLAYASERGPDINIAREIEAFRNYFLDVPGDRGRHLRWDLTWQRWVRTAQERAEDRAARRGGLRAVGNGVPADVSPWQPNT